MQPAGFPVEKLFQESKCLLWDVKSTGTISSCNLLWESISVILMNVKYLFLATVNNFYKEISIKKH